MAREQVSVIARAKARPGMEEKLQQAIEEAVGPTRSEEGCINYDLHRSSEDPSEFLLYENWRSKADLDAHLELPHIKTCWRSFPSSPRTASRSRCSRWLPTRPGPASPLRPAGVGGAHENPHVMRRSRASRTSGAPSLV